MLPLLLVIALLAVIDTATARVWIRRAGFAFAALLGLAVIAFAVDQIRRGIYPQLELPYAIVEPADRAYAVAGEAASVSERAVPAPAPSASRDAVQTTAVAPRKRYEPTSNVQ